RFKREVQQRAHNIPTAVLCQMRLREDSGGRTQIQSKGGETENPAAFVLYHRLASPSKPVSRSSRHALYRVQGEQHDQQEPLCDLAKNVSLLFFQSTTLYGALSPTFKRRN